MAFPFDQGPREKLGIRALEVDEPDPDDPNRPRADWLRLLKVLAKKKLIMHNAAFDLIMMDAGTRYWRGIDLGDQLVWDTMLAHRVLRPTSSAGLDNAAQELEVGSKVGLEEVQAWLKEHKHPKYRYDLVPWEIIKTYVTIDAETTLRLYYAQFELLESGWVDVTPETLLKEIERERDLAVTLMRIEKRGLGYDARRSLKAAKEMEAKAAELEARIPFPVTPHGAKKWFLEQGLATSRTTPKGAPSIDAEQIRDWEKEGVEWAREYREASRAKRAASMWYRGYAEKMGPDGRLRCRYRQTLVIDNRGDAEGARSGRLSVERVNLQAMPKGDKIEDGMVGVRDLLKAEKGHRLVSLDMSQAELRCAAHYSGCVKMEQMLTEGIDFHGKTTEDVMHVYPDHPEWKLKRDIGKKLTFGSIFGIGGERFQALLSKETGLHISIEEAYALVQGWRRTYPEIMDAYRRAERIFRERGYVRILPGTEYESRSYLAERDWPHTGWNRMVQGSLAAWLKLWLVEVENEHPDTIVLTVHDSLVLELPRKGAKAVAQEVADKAAARATDLFGTTMSVEIDLY